MGVVSLSTTSPVTSSSMFGLCLWFVVFLALFTCVSLITVFSTARASSGVAAQQVMMFTVGAAASAVGGGSGGAGAAAGGELPAYVFDALVQYAVAAGNTTASMPEEDVRAIASVLRRRALNHGGRTVFLDENPYYVAHLEGAHPGIEAYATAVREFPDHLDAARASQKAECCPVQNLLFFDCYLAINDIPNQLYDVAWNVILVDGL